MNNSQALSQRYYWLQQPNATLLKFSPVTDELMLARNLIRWLIKASLIGLLHSRHGDCLECCNANEVWMDGRTDRTTDGDGERNMHVTPLHRGMDGRKGGQVERRSANTEIHH